MGSDFQRVEILEVDKAASVIVVQITEIHPDADAIHRLLGKTGEEYLARALAAPLRKTTIPRGKAYYARNFAAQLLADYGKSGLLAAAEAEEDEDDPNPNDFISPTEARPCCCLTRRRMSCTRGERFVPDATTTRRSGAGGRPPRSCPRRGCRRG
jgi:hypothetical protein